MPLQLSPKALQQLICLGLAVRNVSDCHLDVHTDAVRLRATSEAKTLHLDHSLPIPSTQTPVDNETRSLWVRLEDIANFLNIGAGEVTLSLPFETADSRVVLQSNGLTYRFSPTREAYRLFEDPSATPVTTLTVPHRAFHRGVQAANLVGEKMHLQVTPEASHIEFSSNLQAAGDSFLYPLSPDQITAIDGGPSSFTVSIDRLRDITPLIPDTCLASLTFANNCLVYHAEYPHSGAEITLYIAERLSRLQE